MIKRVRILTDKFKIRFVRWGLIPNKKGSKNRVGDIENPCKINFKLLVNTISNTHNHFQQQASKAINISLTLRNWLFGFYIVDFEQKGKDRAKYGIKLIDTLAASIQIKGLGSTNLKTIRIFYQTCNSMAEIIQSFLLPSQVIQIRQSPTEENNTEGKST